MSCVGWTCRAAGLPLPPGISSSMSLRLQVTCETHSVPQTCMDVIVLEFGRGHPVRQGAHVLGRQAVGAHERELLEVLQTRRVEDDTVLTAAQVCRHASPSAVSSAASERKSDSKKTRSKAIPRRASVLRWPEMTHARVLYQSSSASRSPPRTRLSNSSAASPRSVNSRVSESSGCSISSAPRPMPGRLRHSPRSRCRRSDRSSHRRPARSRSCRPLFMTPAIASPMLRPASEIRLRRSTWAPAWASAAASALPMARLRK